MFCLEMFSLNAITLRMVGAGRRRLGCRRRLLSPLTELPVLTSSGRIWQSVLILVTTFLGKAWKRLLTIVCRGLVEHFLNLSNPDIWSYKILSLANTLGQDLRRLLVRSSCLLRFWMSLGLTLFPTIAKGPRLPRSSLTRYSLAFVKTRSFRLASEIFRNFVADAPCQVFIFTLMTLKKRGLSMETGLNSKRHMERSLRNCQCKKA